MTPLVRAILSTVTLLLAIGLVARSAYHPSWKVRQQESNIERIGPTSRSECSGKRCEATDFVELRGRLATAARELAARSKREREEDPSVSDRYVDPYAEEMKELESERARMQRTSRWGAATALILLGCAVALLGLMIAFIVLWRLSGGHSKRLTLLVQLFWVVAGVVAATSVLFYTRVEFLEVIPPRMSVTEAGSGLYLALSGAALAFVGGVLAYLAVIRPVEPTPPQDP